MKIIITGGTGLIGKALCAEFATDGHDVTVLSRNPEKAQRKMASGTKLEKWDAKTANGWGYLADGADAIINLAGAGIADKRWTPSRKEAIYQSRLDAGQAVVEAVKAATNKPSVVIQSSAVGYYGVDNGDNVLTENSGPGSDYLAQVCFDWEASTSALDAMGVRRPVIRTGIVLSNDGGAWPKIKLPFLLFAGGPLGSGKQWYPWIHIDDEIRAIKFLLENAEANGVFNLSAPEPVTNKQLAKTTGRVMGRPGFVPAPGAAMKIALGEMATIVLDGQRAVPHKLEELGFSFEYPYIEEAVRELTGKAPRKTTNAPTKVAESPQLEKVA